MSQLFYVLTHQSTKIFVFRNKCDKNFKTTVMDEPNSFWTYLPYPALLRIFQFLPYKDLLSVSEVCHSWYEVSRLDLLWKRLFLRNFLVDNSVPIISGKTWHKEFKRLCYNVPVVQTETLHDHGHQVLHVSFSHNGKYFATCSKDGYVLLWNSSYPVSIKYSKDMKIFSWKYTQYSQFNESDTLLLVSGVHFGTPHSTSGEIAVFSVDAGFELQCRVVNKPYDIYGTWYNDHHLLSGNLHWLAHLVSASSLWLNKASQEIDSEHVPITHNIFKFYNRNASSIRAIMIAKCLPNSEFVNEPEEEIQHENCKRESSRNAFLEHGNPVSHSRDIKTIRCTHTSSEIFRSDTCSKLKRSNPDLANPIWYNADYRQVESEMGSFSAEEDSEDEVEDEESSNKDDYANEESEEDLEQSTESDKYLIFTTGFKTYTPHQIGFKRIKPFTFPKRIDPGPSLKERLILQERARELLKSGSPPPEPNWLDYDAVADKFDKIDHLIDLHGHIVGMGLSPDHRFLYVNSRSWPEASRISNPLDPPPIAQEIDIHVIDLVTLKQVGTMLRAHKAYTSNSECFFIFLDVCNEYVASGAEDKHGYLWDRHYGVCLMKFPHTDVVNSVAFNPTDPEMLVTTSDDHTIKVWRSRAKVKELLLNESQFLKAVEFRKTRAKNRR